MEKASIPGERPGDPRTGKALVDATRPFAVESLLRSWWCVASTIAAVGAALGAAAVIPWWPLRLAMSVLGGLLLVRAFILYHDFMHHSLLRRSLLARAGFHLFGWALLTPPRYWRYSHNFHHANVGKPVRPDGGPGLLVTSDIGTFPLMTTEMWRKATFPQRLRYRISRHPLTLLLAYLTVFLYSLCLLPLMRDPRRYWDGALAILAHGGLVATLWVFAGFPALFFSFLLPFSIAAAGGAYLFFAQHNYDGMRVLSPEEWTYYRGAIESSSYMKLGPILHWFTGNIGYHHIHHLNPLIPFYRLPEAMAAVPELQRPVVTSLHPRDVLSCLKLHLWDPEGLRLVGFRAAARPS